MKDYSPHFQTLHDESQPTGRLGRGTHYSVLRATVWHDERREPLKEAHNLDFAIIWDEDHDERVITAAESLYLRGWLTSAIFIGERKAGFSFLMSDSLEPWLQEEKFEVWSRELDDLMQSFEDDPWNGDLGFAFGENDFTIINDKTEKVNLYLTTINMLWELGVKPIGH